MNEMYKVVVGDGGSLMLPAQIRERADLPVGTELVLIESPDGLALLTRAQLKDRVRPELAVESLIDDLVADRRAAAAAEDRAT